MRTYLKRDVYSAAVERVAFVFDNFEHINVAFSGGKDSGVLLNLAIDEARKRGRRISVLFMDLEGVYKRTEEFVERMMENNQDVVDPFWVCLPMTTTNAVSLYEPYWTFWDESKRDKWIRPIPQGAITTSNHQFDFFRDGMSFEEFVDSFGDWFSRTKGGESAHLVGLRTVESLNRYRAMMCEKGMFKNVFWSTKKGDSVYNFYALFDWDVQDIWIYNGKFKKDYNKLYDLFYRAGVPLSKQRVCEPYGDEQRAGLGLFKIVEPETWGRVVDRVSGANFGSIYANSKATGMKHFPLPKGHTWKSYCKFLLTTLEPDMRSNYVRKFKVFMKYWYKHGSPLEPDLAVSLMNKHSDVTAPGKPSNRGRKGLPVVKFKRCPDELPEFDSKSDFLSWKRMCMAILKMDHTCKTLSFSLTKKDIARREEILRKYKNL